MSNVFDAKNNKTDIISNAFDAKNQTSLWYRIEFEK